MDAVPKTVIKGVLGEVAQELKHIWSDMEYMMNFRGSMSTSVLGIGRLVSALVKGFTGKDLALELFTSAWNVEWGGVFDATVYPGRTEGYSEQGITEMIAGYYSGMEDKLVPNDPGSIEAVLEGLLAIDNDSALGDICEVFDGKDCDRLRNAVYEVALKNQDEGYLRCAIEKFNAKVEKYEGNTERLLSIDVAGALPIIATVAATMAGADPVAAGGVGLGTWLAKAMVSGKKASGIKPRSTILDTMKGINAFTPPDVVLVARLNSEVRRLRQKR